MIKTNNKPVFITGTWRSGTTLISRIVNTFDNYQVTYDTLHFMRFLFTDLAKAKTLEKKKKFIKSNQTRLNKRYKLDIDFSKVIKNLKREDKIEKIYDDLMRSMLKCKVQWGEKTNLQSHNIENFLKLFSSGYVILIIRDPRAVLNSWKKYTFNKGDEYINSIFNSFVSLTYAKKFQENKRVIVIKYEDLIQFPKKTVKKICKTMKIRFKQKYLDFKNYTDINKNQWNTNSVYKSSNFFDKKKINNWKRDLNKNEIKLTETINFSLMNFFSYNCVSTREKLESSYFHKILQNNFSIRENILLYLSNRLKMERYPNDPRLEKNWGK